MKGKGMGERYLLVILPAKQQATRQYVEIDRGEEKKQDKRKHMSQKSIISSFLGGLWQRGIGAVPGLHSDLPAPHSTHSITHRAAQSPCFVFACCALLL